MKDFEKEQLEKYNKLSQLLEAEYCLIHLDSGLDDVLLPPHLLKRFQVTLQISRFFRSSLELTKEHISTELLFEGSYVSCYIPLVAIWGATSATGENTLWPESAPREILAKILGESLRLEKGGNNDERHSAPKSTSTRTKASLKSVSPSKSPQLSEKLSQITPSKVSSKATTTPKLTAVPKTTEQDPPTKPTKKTSKKKTSPTLKLVK